MDSCSMIMMNPSSCSFNKSTSSSSTMGFAPSSSFSRRKSLKIGGFCDKGQLQYYQSSTRIRCGGEKKKVKLEEQKKKKKKGEKLLKGFSRDLSVLYGMGFGLDSEYYQEKQLNHQGLKFNMMSEATELLVEQLKQVRIEDKELKKKIKMEEKQKRKAEEKSRMSASCLESSSSSSSESSDSESEKQMVVDLTRARSVCSLAKFPVIVPTIPRLQEYVYVSLLPTTEASVEEEKKRVGSELGGMVKNKIEVCMGGKCKKAGAARLMEEFERVAGLNNDDIAVCGCKCMGKCKDGPNVRVVNTPTSDVKNPLCLGVGVDDVGLILSNFFEDQNHPTRVLAAAAAM